MNTDTVYFWTITRLPFERKQKKNLTSSVLHGYGPGHGQGHGQGHGRSQGHHRIAREKS